MSPRRTTQLLGTATVLLGTSTLVRLVGDHGVGLLVLAAVLTPLLVVPLALVGVAQLLLRRRLLAVVTAALVALNVAWLVPLYTADQPPQGTALTVLNANLYFGEASASALVRQVREHRVDVLATEELTPQAVDALRAAGLEQELPYSELASFDNAAGCGLWSRYPLDSLAPFAAFFQSPAAVVHAPGGDVEVHVLHPLPVTLVGGGGGYRADYELLTKQVRALDPSRPIVLAGDFNATVDSQAFRQLMGPTFRDASEVAGSGLQRTWNPVKGWPALLHLDHVLVNEVVGVSSTAVLPLED